jgi:hypothetical protein
METQQPSKVDVREVVGIAHEEVTLILDKIPIASYSSRASGETVLVCQMNLHVTSPAGSEVFYSFSQVVRIDQHFIYAVLL